MLKKLVEKYKGYGMSEDNAVQLALAEFNASNGVATSAPAEVEEKPVVKLPPAFASVEGGLKMTYFPNSNKGSKGKHQAKFDKFIPAYTRIWVANNKAIKEQYPNVKYDSSTGAWCWSSDNEHEYKLFQRDYKPITELDKVQFEDCLDIEIEQLENALEDLLQQKEALSRHDRATDSMKSYRVKVSK